MNKIIPIFFLLFISIFLLGCGNTPPKEVSLGVNANANSIVPDLESYQTDKEVLKNQGSVVGGAIATGVANAGGVSAPFSGAIGIKMKNFIECAAKEGAGNITHYYTTEDQLDHTVLAVAEGDSQKILKCLVKSAFNMGLASIGGGPTYYGIYGHSYTVKNTDTGRNFYIIFLGTADKGSYALCDKLPGCKKDEMFAVAVYSQE